MYACAPENVIQSRSVIEQRASTDISRHVGYSSIMCVSCNKMANILPNSIVRRYAQLSTRACA